MCDISRQFDVPRECHLLHHTMCHPCHVSYVNVMCHWGKISVQGVICYNKCHFSVSHLSVEPATKMSELSWTVMEEVTEDLRRGTN